VDDIVLTDMLGREVLGEGVEYSKFDVVREVIRRREMSALDIKPYKSEVRGFSLAVIQFRGQ
jgi:hypothetical protein